MTLFAFGRCEWALDQYCTSNTRQSVEIMKEQECIQVGCIPSTAVAVSWDWSAPGRGVREGGILACTEADTPHVDRHTPVKNITSQLRCGR